MAKKYIDADLLKKEIERQKQMLKDAVEGDIVQDVYSRELRCKTKDLRKGGFKFGDKVKIVIVRED